MLSDTNLDQELRVSRALQNALSASGLDDAARLRALQRLDGRALEAVLLFMILSLSGDDPAEGSMTALSTSEPGAKAATERICIGDIQLDPIRRIVFKRARCLHLTPKEFELLHYLMARAGVPVRHAELLRKIWGIEYSQELEYLRTFIYQLRRKVEDNPTIPRYLLTEPHFGYRFEER